MIGTSRQRQDVGDNVRVETHATRFSPTPFQVGLLEVLNLPVGRQGRDTLAAHRADGIPEPIEPTNGTDAPNIDQAQPHPATMMNGLGTPRVRTSSVVLISLGPVDRHGHLKPQFLLV